MPNFYPNQPQSNGIMDFFSNLLVSVDEIKVVGIIAALFFMLNMQPVINMVGKYLAFTVNELGNSSMIGHVCRGLIAGLIFVITNKFV